MDPVRSLANNSEGRHKNGAPHSVVNGRGDGGLVIINIGKPFDFSADR